MYNLKHLPEIRIQVIPPESQWYPTAGDYIVSEDVWEIKVNEFSDPRYEFLVVIHELVELFLTQRRGIKEEDITRFDIEFEEKLDRGETEYDEPGNDLKAPYYREHQFATRIERLVAEELNVDWEKYEEEVVNTVEEAKPITMQRAQKEL